MRHADQQWREGLARDRDVRAAGGTHFPSFTREAVAARRLPLPRRSRWQRFKDELSRRLRK